MSFAFERMGGIGARLAAWWHGEGQERPLLVCTVPGAVGAPPETAGDLDRWWTDASFRTEQAMRAIDAATCHYEAVPYHYVDFGSSAMASLLGARMEFVDRETVWAYPVYDSVEEAAEASIDRSSPYYRYLRRLTELSSERAPGHHYVTLFALGAPGDTLAAIYGTERLLIDMIERPNRVEQAMGRMKRLWIECLHEFNRIIDTAGNPGNVGWAGVWAPGTTFPMQEDFSYMISPDMFRRFCLPHIVDMVDVLEYPMYHLDGMGAIGHLDALLDIVGLRVIQWVPGAGHERIDRWYDLIRHVLDRGKSIQVFAEADEIPGLVAAVGTRGLLVTVTNPTREGLRELQARYRP